MREREKSDEWRKVLLNQSNATQQSFLHYRAWTSYWQPNFQLKSISTFDTRASKPTTWSKRSWGTNTRWWWWNPFFFCLGRDFTMVASIQNKSNLIYLQECGGTLLFPIFYLSFLALVFVSTIGEQSDWPWALALAWLLCQNDLPSSPN